MGGPEGVFPEMLGPRGGPGTPRGGRAVFRGGPRGPVGGPCEFRGGARGGPEAPVMTKPGYAYVFEVQRASRKHAKTNRKTWFLYMKCPIMTSPLFCAHANGRRGTHGKPRGTKGSQKRPQGGSKGGPGAAKGAQGRPKGGPRGAKGGPRDPRPSLSFHFWSQNGPWGI